MLKREASNILHMDRHLANYPNERKKKRRHKLKSEKRADR